jgi:hypothetical protein
MYTPCVLLELFSYTYSGKFICPGLQLNFTNHQFIIQHCIQDAVETVPPHGWGWVRQKLHCDLTVKCKFPEPSCFSPESTIFLKSTAWNLLTSWGPVSFPQRTLLHGVSYVLTDALVMRDTVKKITFWGPYFTCQKDTYLTYSVTGPVI